MQGKDDQRPPRTSPVFRAIQGWQPARVLMVATRLSVFDTIGEKQLTVEEIAKQSEAHPRSLTLLLNACVALKFLHKEGDLYSNSAEALELLIPGKRTYMGDVIAHSEDIMRLWMELERSVRTNQAVRCERERSPETLRSFILSMHNRAMASSQVLVDNLDLSDRRQLFDAGGGPGTYSIFLAKSNPNLRAIVFDLPNVVEIATEMISRYGLEDRVSTQAGDYFNDDFGQNNDVVLLSAILHSMGPDRCKLLLRKAYNSLVKGGLVVVQESLINPDGTSPVFAALFSLNMLVHTGEGQSWSGKEIVTWMEEAGFADPYVRPLPTSAFNMSLVIGTKI